MFIDNTTLKESMQLYRMGNLDFTPDMEVQSIPLIVSAVGPPKTDTIANRHYIRYFYISEPCRVLTEE